MGTSEQHDLDNAGTPARWCAWPDLNLILTQAYNLVWCSPQRALSILDRFSPTSEEALPDSLRAGVMLIRGWARLHLGRFAEARPLLEQAEAVFRQENDVLGVARCLHARANWLHLTGQDEGVNVALERVGAAFQALKAWDDGADCARSRATLLFLAGDPAAARACLVEAQSLPVSPDSPWRPHLARNVEGMILNAEGRFAEAETVLGEAAAALAGMDCPSGQAIARFERGRAVDQSGRYAEALELYQQAQAIFQREGIVHQAACCLQSSGVVFWRMAEYDRAANFVSQAADLWAQAGIPGEEAAARLKLGDLLYSQGRYSAALKQYSEAYGKYKEAGLPNGMGRAQVNQSRVYRVWGEYSRVLALLQEAADLFGRGGDVAALTSSHESLADLYALLGQEGWALDLYGQAEAALAKEGATSRVARCAQSRGRILGRQGKLVEALEQVRRAELLFHEEQLPLQEAGAWIDKGAILLLAGRADEARACYEKARQTFAARHVLLDVARCDLGLGEARMFQGDWPQAENDLARALEIVAPAFPDFAWRGYAGRAVCAEQTGRPAEALAELLQAIEAIRRARAWAPGDAWNDPDRPQRVEVYRRALRLAAERNDGTAALQVMEAARAQSLSALLTERGEKLPSAAVAGDEAFDLVRQEIESLRQEVKGQSENGIPDVQERLCLIAARMEQYEVEGQERWTHARVGSLHGWMPSFDLEQFRREAGKIWPSGWLALAYDLDEALTIVAVDQEGCQVWRRILSTEERSLLEQYCATDREVARSLYSSGDPSTASGRALRLLYDLLIPASVAARLSPERPLLLVPNSCLDGLPFAALFGSGGALVEQADLALLPCLHSLLALLQPFQGDPYTAPWQRLLLLGVAHFDGRWPELPLAAEELGRIETLWRGRADVRCLADITAVDFLRAIRGDFASHCDLLHLSTHTRVGDVSSWGVHVALRDKDVLFEDMLGLGLNARLLILAACRPYVERPYGAEEKAGLPWVFFTIGVAAIVANLWEEDEASGIELMERFHSALRDGKRPGQALSEAQRAMAAAGLAPYQWGGFVVMGVP